MKFEEQKEITEEDAVAQLRILEKQSRNRRDRAKSSIEDTLNSRYEPLVFGRSAFMRSQKGSNSNIVDDQVPESQESGIIQMGSQESGDALKSIKIVENHDYCSACKNGGQVICCGGCPRSFHVEQCLYRYCKKNNLFYEEPLQDIDGKWFCPRCKPTIKNQDKKQKDTVKEQAATDRKKRQIEEQKFLYDGKSKMQFEQSSLMDASKFMEESSQEENTVPLARCLKDHTIVVTGCFKSTTREEVESFIKQHGGKITGSVSGRTDFLIAGYELDDGRETHTGKKYRTALEKEVPILTEEAFQKFIRDRTGISNFCLGSQQESSDQDPQSIFTQQVSIKSDPSKQIFDFEQRKSVKPQIMKPMEEQKFMAQPKKSNPPPNKSRSSLSQQGVPQFYNENANSFINLRKSDTNGKSFQQLVAEKQILNVDQEIFVKLFDHQIEGINFLFKNFKKKEGCILADDMGLGKTVQLSVFMTSLKIEGLINKCLVVVPGTLIQYWESEILRWAPKKENIQVRVFQGNKKVRAKAINDVKGMKVFAIISPESFKQDFEIIQKACKWDIMVIDEGHRAKNTATQLRKALKAFNVTKQKIILTGTPVQNNLDEFYSIIDLVQDGIFGTQAEFKRQFAIPIKKGLQKFARPRQKRDARDRCVELKQYYKPFFIRRTKREIFKTVSSELQNTPLLWNELPLKTDLVVWIPLSAIQKKIYHMIVSSHTVQDSLSSLDKKHIFVTILALKQLCVHPMLLLNKVYKEEQKDGGGDSSDSDQISENGSSSGCEKWQPQAQREDLQTRFARLSDNNDGFGQNDGNPQDIQAEMGVNMNELLKKTLKMIRKEFELDNFDAWNECSSKVQFVFELLEKLRQEGHKVLIFSKTKILLNMIEKIMKKKAYEFVRLDGDVKIPLRDGICQDFNNDPNIFCFLLTSQVSGVGLNLVAADRAIVLDPDWNPANDNQSIDRCYRIGQKRDVIIYRLISTNTVEDKIYQRQVSKIALSKATIDDDQRNVMKYFDEQEFAQLLKYEKDEIGCPTLDKINKKHLTQKELKKMKKGDLSYLRLPETPTNKIHSQFLTKLKLVEGISNHGILFSSQEEISPEEDQDLEEQLAQEVRDLNNTHNYSLYSNPAYLLGLQQNQQK